MIEALTARLGLKHGTCWSPQEDTLFRFKYDQVKRLVEYEALKKEKFSFIAVAKAFDHYKKDKPKVNGHLWEDDQSSVNLSNLTYKHISKEIFRERYPNCAYCDASMHFEYEESVVIDIHTALCGDCVAEGAKPDLPLSFMQ